MSISPTGIRPVGTYNPARSYPNPPGASYTPPAPPRSHTPPVSIEFSPGTKAFFGDIGSGFASQLKAHGRNVINPIKTVDRWLDTSPRQMMKNVIAPYKQDFKSGHGARAIGRLAADAAVIGGAVLGGRWLFQNGLGRMGGGAGVGMGGGGLLGGVGRVIGGIGNAIGGVFRGIGNIFRGGAGVGMG